uniref:TAFII28 domain-containing protein n=1 Tax=Panagrellus redivivus TaxID=6233 RepID=A0A7E4V0L5_PANRE
MNRIKLYESVSFTDALDELDDFVPPIKKSESSIVNDDTVSEFDESDNDISHGEKNQPAPSFFMDCSDDEGKCYDDEALKQEYVDNEIYEIAACWPIVPGWVVHYSDSDKILLQQQLEQLNNMSTAELRRHELLRSCHFDESDFTQRIKQAAGTRPTSNFVVAVSTLAKIFVGDLVQTALHLKNKDEPESSPLKPAHLREAMYILEEQDLVYPKK